MENFYNHFNEGWKKNFDDIASVFFMFENIIIERISGEYITNFNDNSEQIFQRSEGGADKHHISLNSLITTEIFPFTVIWFDEICVRPE